MITNTISSLPENIFVKFYKKRIVNVRSCFPCGNFSFDVNNISEFMIY